MALRQPNAICTVCEKPYWIANYKLAKSRFCSRACQSAGRKTWAVSKDDLSQFYYDERLSMQEIAARLGCSMHKVAYWMDKYGFNRRGWSEATYVKRNPDGDPFKISLPETVEDKELFALAIGLYMGEGEKKNTHRVSMANTDPAILRIFLLFLEKFCGIDKSDVGAWLNIFDDCDVEAATKWWADQVGLNLQQFSAPAVRKSKGGSYLCKSKHGTLSIYFLNSKLKIIVNGWCSEYHRKFFTPK